MSWLEIAYVGLGVAGAVVVIGGAVWLAILEARRRTAGRWHDAEIDPTRESPRP